MTDKANNGREALLNEAAEIAMGGWHSVEKGRAFANRVTDYILAASQAQRTETADRPEIWADIERTLRSVIDDGLSAELDELDASLLLDLVRRRTETPGPAAPMGYVVVPMGESTPLPDYAECARQATEATGLPSQYPGAWLSIFIREISRWCEHRVAHPPACPAPDISPENEAHILEVYRKVHEGKIGAHWLWCVIEQIAAGVSEEEAIQSFGYYSKSKEEDRGS